jgi:hypothetical protein
MSVPDTMRALVAQGVGEPADVLRLESRPLSEPGDRILDIPDGQAIAIE